MKSADLREEKEKTGAEIIYTELKGVQDSHEKVIISLKTSSHTHVTEWKFAGHGVRPWTDDLEGKGYGLETKSPEPTQLPLLFLKLSAGEGQEKWGEIFH